MFQPAKIQLHIKKTKLANEISPATERLSPATERRFGKIKRRKNFTKRRLTKFFRRFISEVSERLFHDRL